MEQSVQVSSQTRIPKVRSLTDFIIAPGRWRLPNVRNLGALYARMKTNLLYFQTNYFICGCIMFIGLMILSMKTLLTGVVSAIVLILAGLFFFEHIPQARQIKQNHPTLVIVAGVALILVTWYALRTILLVLGAALAPVPFYLIHAACRSSDGLIEQAQMGGDYFAGTPLGQMMRMVGIEPRASSTE